MTSRRYNNDSTLSFAQGICEIWNQILCRCIIAYVHVHVSVCPCRIKIRTFLLTFRISFAAYLPWHGNPGWYPILAALSKKENINWILFLNRHFGHVFRRKNRGYLISESLAAASTPRNLHQRVDSTIITNSSSLPYYHGIYIWLLYHLRSVGSHWPTFCQIYVTY